jgi:hypothetical protein
MQLSVPVMQQLTTSKFRDRARPQPEMTLAPGPAVMAMVSAEQRPMVIWRGSSMCAQPHRISRPTAARGNCVRLPMHSLGNGGRHERRHAAQRRGHRRPDRSSAEDLRCPSQPGNDAHPKQLPPPPPARSTAARGRGGLCPGERHGAQPALACCPSPSPAGRPRQPSIVPTNHH